MLAKIEVLKKTIIYRLSYSGTKETDILYKKMILSNLNVHQEQKPSKSTYFDPNNAEQLADKIEDYWMNTVTPIDADLENQARETIQSRSIEFAERFLKIINE